MIYNHERNTINTMDAQLYVNFMMIFSPKGVEYIDSNDNFWGFLIYLLGVVDNILAIIKFANVLGSLVRPKDAGLLCLTNRLL